MNNTLVVNSGSTQSVLIKNGKAKTNGVEWKANYNGDIANVDLKLNDNGREKQFKVEMTNDELENLADMLVVPRPVNKPIHNRLLEDFDENTMESSMPMIIELDNIKPYVQPNTPRLVSRKPSDNFLTHISSPTSFEDLIIPFPKTSRRRRRRPKTYRVIKVKKHKRPKTYRIIKVKKNNVSSRRSSRRLSRR
jgi:hypothetical protein